MSEEINHDRRRLLSTAVLTFAAAELGLIGSEPPQPEKKKPASIPSIRPRANTSFGALKQIDAGVLNVGFAEPGPADGPAVILLHGWPYDIHSFVDVAPLLASAGYRVIVPHLRGYGTTRFLSHDAVRNGQPSALALDVVSLMDALKIQKAILAGFDWGGRSADIVAALWPERCKGLVSVSGYLIGNQEAGKIPLPPQPSSSGGTSSTSPPSAAERATRSTATASRSSYGSSLHRSGASTMPRSRAALHPSSIRITSAS